VYSSASRYSDFITHQLKRFLCISARIAAARSLEILKSTESFNRSSCLFEEKLDEYFGKEWPRRGLAKFDSHNCYYE